MVSRREYVILRPNNKRYKSKSRSRSARPKKKQAIYASYSPNTLALGQPRGLPTKMTWKTRYSETYVRLNPGVGGTAASHVFSLNGLYDPNITGVGGQPIGFDQIMPLFSHYTVIGFNANVKFINTEVSYPQIVGMYVSNAPATTTDPNVMIQNGSCIWDMIAARNSGGPQVVSLNLRGSVSKFLGRPNILSEDDCRGSIAANPDEQLYLHVFTAPQAGIDTTEADAVVVIDYIAILTERNQVALS